MPSVPTITLNKTVVSNKTLTLLDFESTGKGEKSIVFTNESEALRFSCDVVSITGSFYWEVYEIGGTSPGHNKLLYQSKTLSTCNINHDSLIGGAKIQLNLYHSDAINIKLAATGISAAAAMAVKLDTISQEELEYRAGASESLRHIADLLTKILNHQRILTGIEVDKGDDF